MSPTDDTELDPWLNAPENAQALVGGGTPNESTPEGRSQKARLAGWVRFLEDQSVMEYVIASYEVVPSALGVLVAHQSPAAEECAGRPCRMRSRRAPDPGRRPALRQQSLRSGRPRRQLPRVPIARRSRDASCVTSCAITATCGGLETLNSALDSINLIGNAKLRELSAVNGTLYEFVLASEQKPAEERTLGHVDHQGRHPRFFAPDALPDGLGLEPGLLLQPELLRSGEQAAAEVRRQQSLHRGRRRHPGVCTRKKAKRASASAVPAYWPARWWRLSAAITNSSPRAVCRRLNLGSASAIRMPRLST